ncbi:Vesicular glutamate transporter 3 [Araneus ventricosus]|uniref:Vesicular glutamate transporter 3 n=1 Tax=Araneus ventricosus TaxID=182803 RepID=A0A4Y2DWK4_ARAVE|nr:Vesicular glutamate transporter 3 [Araneus ventricosus]
MLFFLSRSKLKGQEDEKGFMKDDELGGDFYDELQRKKPRSKAFMEPECPCCRNLSKRYTIALLSSLGFVISFGIRCNLSNAIVKMVEPIDGNPPEFDWSPNTIGLMDSSFFWGYLITQIPGGFLATKYPPNRIFGTAIAISAFLNLLIPKSAQIHTSVVMIVRILQGLVERLWGCNDIRICLRDDNFCLRRLGKNPFPYSSCTQFHAAGCTNRAMQSRCLI